MKSDQKISMNSKGQTCLLNSDSLLESHFFAKKKTLLSLLMGIH